MITCPLCSSVFEEDIQRSIPYPTAAHSRIARKPQSIEFCEKCGVGIALPLLAEKELQELYAGGRYWAHSDSRIILPKKYPVPYALALSRWEIIESFLGKNRGPASILDIGAGHGFLGMVAARREGFNLGKYVCVEQDKALAASLRKTWMSLFPGYALVVDDHIDLIEGEFDCIVFSHVLEHQANARELFESALKRLAPGGLVFIDVPNQDYLFKDDVFPHLLFFNSSSLRFLLEGGGLRVLHLGCYGQSMNRSPLNHRNRSKARRLAIEMITALRAVIPESLFLSFFSWYFGVNKQSCHGTWLRAIARNSGKRDSNAVVDQGQQL